MKYIIAKCGTKIMVDDEDYAAMNAIKWFIKTSTRGLKYAVGRIYNQDFPNGKHVRMSRIIINCPPDKEADHRNHDTLDNRRKNLRVVTRTQGNVNRRPFGASGYKGVIRDNNRWISSITVCRKRFYLGSFDSPEEAALAYNAKAKEVHGEFAYLNIIDKVPV